MKTGVLGGSFNPIHVGHLNLAQEAAELLGLSAVYFVVSSRPPHKADGVLADAHHRYRMVELACEGNPMFHPSRVELDREGFSYTVDTMRHFRKRFGKQVYFITGQDAMEDIGSWKSAASLLKTYNFIVAARPGYDSSALLDVLQAVLDINYVNVKLKALGQSADGMVESIGITGAGSVIHIVQVTALDISSSRIRGKLRKGQSVKYLVPQSVGRYLEGKKVFDDHNN